MKREYLQGIVDEDEGDEAEDNPFKWWKDENKDEDKDKDKVVDEDGMIDMRLRGDNVHEDDGLSQEAANGDNGQREAEGEEARAPKILRGPPAVSKQERDEHNAMHTPFRQSCKYCVRGRARNMMHEKADAQDGEMKKPRICMDYFLMSEEDKKANKDPMLVMIADETKEKYAKAVGHKGLGQDGEMAWLIKDLSAELKVWGHPGGDGNAIIMKSDGEEAIVAVREALAKLHGGRVVLEAPATGESQSNGMIEEAGKTVRKFVRVFKDQLEDNAEMKLQCDDVITSWIIRWAAMLCSRHMVGKDGKTSYERRRGRRCRLPAVPFREKVWYRQVRDTKDRKDKFESEWKEGIWLGHSRCSNETIVGTDGGLIRACAIRRQAEDVRWDKRKIIALRGSPQQPDPSKPGLAIPIIIKFDDKIEEKMESASDEDAEIVRRRLKITKAVLERYGHTEGCEGCRSQRAGLKEYRNHTEACRSRIEKDMEETEDGSRRRKGEEKRCMPETTEESGAGDVERPEAEQDEMNEDSDKMQKVLPQGEDPEQSEKEEKDHKRRQSKEKQKN